MCYNLKVKLNIKPVSSNRIWAGRRFKTPLYHDFEEEMFLILPKKFKVPEGKLEVYYKFGFSSKLSDVDNPIKPLTDVLQKFYGFNDKQIYKLVVEKELVKSGEEFIEFEIQQIL